VSTITSLAPNFELKKHMKKLRQKIKEIGLYLPVQINLNGQEIPNLADFGISEYEHAIPIGFLALDPNNPSPLVKLLSHNLLVESVKFEKIKQELREATKSRGAIVGVLNYDGFCPVASRNEVQRDSNYNAFSKVVCEEAEQFLTKIVRDYKKTKSKELRKDLIAIGKDYAWMEDVLEKFCREQDFEEAHGHRIGLKAFLDCPLF